MVALRVRRGGDQQRNQLEAIKVAGTIVVLAGGGAALLLSARRQRSAEIALRQKDRDQSLQMRVAIATEADAEARRITYLYTKAVELVGSGNAAVRLGGLYALERLAQDNEGQRQTITNVLCAYLRMPFDPPEEPADPVAAGALNAYREQTQEREVRLTVQRLLLEHLQPGDSRDNPAPTFWKDIDLDLTGAVLIEFSLRHCHVRNALFRSATFAGPFADFLSTTFSESGNFDSAKFIGRASFISATFCNDVSFWHCAFAEECNFDDTTFAKDVVFGGATFADTAHFGGSQFMKDLYFGSARFSSHVIFSTATFGGQVHIGKTTEFGRGTPPEIMPYISND